MFIPISSIKLFPDVHNATGETVRPEPSRKAVKIDAIEGFLDEIGPGEREFNRAFEGAYCCLY
jgi:hypothetical protein